MTRSAPVLFGSLAGAGFGGSGEPSAAVSWIKIGLGVLLLLLAVRQWRGRPKPGTDAALPGWMSAMDSLTPAKAVPAVGGQPEESADVHRGGSGDRLGLHLRTPFLEQAVGT